MENFNEEQTTYLIELIELLNKSKIEVGIIGPWGDDGEWGVGAMSEGGIYALIGTSPEFPATLTLTRVDLLKARLDLARSKSFKIGYEVDGSEIKSLEIKAGRMTMGYRCGKSDDYDVPKKVFTETLATFNVSDDEIAQLGQAVAAFDRDGVISISTGNGELSMVIKDNSGDMYENKELGEAIGDTTLSHMYNSRVVSDLMKVACKEGSASLSIGSRGVLCISNGDSTFYVMASKGR